jgi:hypothetical protein
MARNIGISRNKRETCTALRADFSLLRARCLFRAPRMPRRAPLKAGSGLLASKTCARAVARGCMSSRSHAPVARPARYSVFAPPIDFNLFSGLAPGLDLRVRHSGFDPTGFHPPLCPIAWPSYSAYANSIGFDSYILITPFHFTPHFTTYFNFAFPFYSLFYYLLYLLRIIYIYISNRIEYVSVEKSSTLANGRGGSKVETPS